VKYAANLLFRREGGRGCGRGEEAEEGGEKGGHLREELLLFQGL